MNYKNDHLKNNKEEYESKYDEHRKRNKNELKAIINKKIG